MKNSRLYLSAFISGVIGIGCCVSPIFLVLLGLVSASVAVDLAYNLYDNFAWHFRVAGLLILAIALYFYLKDRNQCSIKGVYKNRALIIGALIIFLITYVSLYWITTFLGTLTK